MAAEVGLLCGALECPQISSISLSSSPSVTSLLSSEASPQPSSRHTTTNQQKPPPLTKNKTKLFSTAPQQCIFSWFETQIFFNTFFVQLFLAIFQQSYFSGFQDQNIFVLAPGFNYFSSGFLLNYFCWTSDRVYQNRAAGGKSNADIHVSWLKRSFYST